MFNWQNDAQPILVEAYRLINQHGPFDVSGNSLADQTGLEIRVCHFPPGTTKWNKIEHRLFSFISQNWRGKRATTNAERSLM